MNEDIEYEPMKEPTFIEKVIIVATMILAAVVVPIAEMLQGSRNDDQ